MPKTITLKATKNHPDRKEGEMYEARGNQAMSDLYLKRAVAYKHKAPAREPEPKVRAKRKYRRRDLQAE